MNEMIILLCHYWDSGEKTSMDGNHLQHKSYNTMYVVFNVSLKNQTKCFAGKCMKKFLTFKVLSVIWDSLEKVGNFLYSFHESCHHWDLLKRNEFYYSLHRVDSREFTRKLVHHVRILKSTKTLEATSGLTFNINWDFESVIDSFGSSGKFSVQKKLVLFKSNLFAQIQEHPIL